MRKKRIKAKNLRAVVLYLEDIKKLVSLLTIDPEKESIIADFIDDDEVWTNSVDELVEFNNKKLGFFTIVGKYCYIRFYEDSTGMDAFESSDKARLEYFEIYEFLQTKQRKYRFQKQEIRFMNKPEKPNFFLQKEAPIWWTLISGVIAVFLYELIKFLFSLLQKYLASPPT